MERKTAEELLKSGGNIAPPDRKTEQRIRARWDNVAKPLDGLGAFEKTVAALGAALGDDDPDLGRRRLLVFCGDHGIVSSGVSQSGQEVTRTVAKALGDGTSSACRMASACHTDVFAVDVGIADDRPIKGVWDRKVARGTQNFLEGPAMTFAQFFEAMQAGLDAVYLAKEEGYALLGVGEMGIGNTASSAAVAAALLGLSAEKVTGRGAGLDDDGLRRKRETVAFALRKYGFDKKGGKKDALEILRTLGGFETVAIAGALLGGAYCRIPVVLDGVITLTAALAIVQALPQVRPYLIASHAGREPAMRYLCGELAMRPVLHGDMALGEGTGALLFFSLLDPVMALYHGTTFGELQMEAYARPDAERRRR